MERCPDLLLIMSISVSEVEGKDLMLPDKAWMMHNPFESSGNKLGTQP